MESLAQRALSGNGEPGGREEARETRARGAADFPLVFTLPQKTRGCQLPARAAPISEAAKGVAVVRKEEEMAAPHKRTRRQKRTRVASPFPSSPPHPPTHPEKGASRSNGIGSLPPPPPPATASLWVALCFSPAAVLEGRAFSPPPPPPLPPDRSGNGPCAQRAPLLPGYRGRRNGQAHLRVALVTLDSPPSAPGRPSNSHQLRWRVTRAAVAFAPEHLLLTRSSAWLEAAAAALRLPSLRIPLAASFRLALSARCCSWGCEGCLLPPALACVRAAVVVDDNEERGSLSSEGACETSLSCFCTFMSPWI